LNTANQQQVEAKVSEPAPAIESAPVQKVVQAHVVEKSIEPETVSSPAQVQTEVSEIPKTTTPIVETETPVAQKPEPVHEETPSTSEVPLEAAASTLVVVEALKAIEKPETKEGAPLEHEKEFSAPIEAETPVVGDKIVPSLKPETTSEPAKEHLETQPIPEFAQPEEQKPIIEEAVTHAEPEQEKEVSIPVVEESVKDTEPEISNKEDENPIKAEVLETKVEESPVVKTEEARTVSEESDTEEVSVVEPEISKAKVDAAPVVERSEEPVTTSKPVSNIQDEAVVPEIKQDSLPVNGETTDEPIEKSEDLVAKNESTPAVERVETQQIEEQSTLPESETKELIETPASAHKEQESISKEIIEETAPVAIITAAAIAEHESASKEPTTDADVSVMDKPIEKEKEAISKETLEATKIESAPTGPQIVYQKENIVESTPETAIAVHQPTASDVVEEDAQPSPVQETSASIVKKSVVPAVVEPPKALPEAVESVKAEPVHESVAPVAVEQPMETLPEPVVKSVNAEPIHESVVPAVQAKEVLPEPVVEIAKPESHSVPESVAPVVPVVETALVEESPKAILAEPVVESSKVEPILTAASAPVNQEAVALEQPKEILPELVVSKATEEPSKEPAPKAVQLPFTVEHVSQPVTPSVEKSEPKLEETKPAQGSEPLTFSKTKAVEVAVPAILAAAVASTSVAKAIPATSGPSPRPSSPTQEDIANIHTSTLPFPSIVKVNAYKKPELDSINETLQQLTKSLSQTSAQHTPGPASTAPEPAIAKAVELASKVSEPVTAKEVEPIVTKSPEPAPSDPTTTQTAETHPSTHETRPITVTIKSVEHIKASPSTSTPTPDKTTPEQPTTIDTSAKSIDTASVSLVSASATPTTPTSTSTPAHTHSRKGSIWRYIWPFGGSSKTTETPKSDKDKDNVVEAAKTSEASDAPAIPALAA
jgi:hypothetical protein